MFDIMFMDQKRNETAQFIWSAPHGPFIRTDQSSKGSWELFTRADAFTRWWDGHTSSTKQRCEIQGPIIHLAQCGTRVFASFSLTQFSFSHPVPRYLNSKCICAHLCAHGRASLKKQEVCSGGLLARCHFEELKIDCAIDQIKPGLKSKVNGAIFFLLFKENVCRKCASGRVHNAHSLCLLHTGTCSSKQTCQILKNKGLLCKKILLCRLHKNKNVIMDSHCVYQN